MLPWWLGMILYSAVLTIVMAFIIKNITGYIGGGGICVIATIIVIILLLVSLGGSFDSWCNADMQVKQTEIRNKQYIYSLEDNINTNGEYHNFFIIGSGYIEQDLYYYTLIGDENGYKMQKYEAEDIYIVPEENVEPYYCEKVEIYDMFGKKNFVFGGLFKTSKSAIDQEKILRKELHLPKNYIKKNYNIDLK